MSCQENPASSPGEDAGLTDGAQPPHFVDAGPFSDAGPSDAGGAEAGGADAGSPDAQTGTSVVSNGYRQPPATCPPAPAGCSDGGWCVETIADDVQPVVFATGEVDEVDEPDGSVSYGAGSRSGPGFTYALWADGTVIFMNFDSTEPFTPGFLALDPTVAWEAVSIGSGDNEPGTGWALIVAAGDGALYENDCDELPCAYKPATFIPDRMRAVAALQPGYPIWAVGDRIYEWTTAAGWTEAYDPGDLLENLTTDDYDPPYQTGSTVFAVGKAGGVIVRRDDVGGWHEDVPFPGLDADVRFHDIANDSDGNPLAVGDDGLAAKWRSGEWEPFPTGTTDSLLKFLSYGTVVQGELHDYAVGTAGLVQMPDAPSPDFPLETYDYVPQTGLSFAGAPRTWGFPAEEAIETGATLQHCDAAGCSAFFPFANEPPELIGVVSTPSLGEWVIAANGLALERGTDAWQPMPANLFYPTGIQGSDAGIWAFGEVVSTSTGGLWTVVPPSPRVNISTNFSSVVMSTEPAGAVSFESTDISDGNTSGCGASVELLGGTGQEPVDSLPRDGGQVCDTGPATTCAGGILLTGQWQSGVDRYGNLLESLALFSWNGTAWTGPIPVPGFSVSANGFPISIWAASCDDAWLVTLVAGGGSEVLHWTGGQWQPIDLGTGQPFAVWGRSDADIFLVGAQGAIWHWDGNAWAAQDSGTTVNLLGVGGDAQNVWAVGDCGVIVHLSD